MLERIVLLVDQEDKKFLYELAKKLGVTHNGTPSISRLIREIIQNLRVEVNK